MSARQLSLLDRDWATIHAPEVVSCMRGRTFTADDLHAILPEPQERNWYGVLLARMKCLGMVERVGYTPSLRPQANGRVVGLWRVSDQQS